MRAKMLSSLLLASFVLCGSILLTSGADIDCEIDLSNPCKCSFTDESGKKWNIDISGYFGGYPTNPKPDDKKYKYYYYCSNHVCPENTEEGVACQLDSDKENVDIPLGKVDIDTTWVVTDTADDSFSFVITYKNGQPVSETKHRQAQVTFKYGADSMAMKVNKEEDSGEFITYLMEATGNQVKKVAQGGGGGGGVSKKGGGGNAAGPSEDEETQGAYSQEPEKDTV